MKKLFLIPSVCTILSGFSVADTYQSQVDLGYLDVEDVETTLIQGTFHFAEVESEGKPYREAAFLNKASDVHVSLTNIDGPGGSSDLKNLGARYVANEKWIIEGDYIDGDGSDVKALGLGAYLTDAISLTARYATADEIDAYGATLKGFSPGANNGGIAYEVSLTRAEEEDEFLGTSESETTYGGALTYYTNERFGIGLAYEDRESSSTIGLEVDYFFTPNFAGSVGFVSIDADGGDGNADGFLLGLTGRF